MYYELTDRFVVSSDVQKTWQFFSTADNLPAITPPWLNFTIRTPGKITIELDTLIDYTITWMKVPVRWRTRIIDWSPPHQFIDLQTRGPYTLWHHQHTFTPIEEGVECTDRVIYKLPTGPLGRLIHAAFVRRQLLEIFRYRRTVIAKNLGWVRAVQPDVQIRKLI